MEKINWKNGKTPINQTNLNGMQEGIEKSCVAVSPTQPTSNESVWIKTGKNRFNGNIKLAWLSSGIIVPSEQNAVSDYIEVIAGLKYTVSTEQTVHSITISTFDENHNFIDTYAVASSNIHTITVDNSTKYIRFWVNYDNQTKITDTVINNLKIMVEQNDTRTSFEPYIDKEIYVKNDNGVFERFYSESEMNKQNYSQTEQKIGTWIDGKPIYRKVFVGTSNTQTNVTIQNHAENIDTIVHAYGQLENSTGMKLTVLSDNQSNVWANNTFTIYINNASIDTYKYKLIYEYTKTTD